ncbi:cytochrome P450 [Fomitopsis serialis]|uniref:cytochrome P450 n=1 Tax=Fomitopsis serialis TaxID=139415 RepID=UPI002008D971|nr:cytochrome P450 [Neoantrodia serialis]KAH9929334.1 cytochrome P450 [Neoantrodia serialis]
MHTNYRWNTRSIPLGHGRRITVNLLGDLIYVEFFASRTIINSSKIARDLLDKRGAIYSSRPRLVTFVELVGWDPTLVFAPYQHESRRRQRRWVQAAFGEKDTLRKYEGLQHREVCILLSSLINTPKNFTMHITRYTVALIVESVYGHRITSLEDEYVTLVDRSNQATSATGPAGGGMVDHFPLLKHIPTWMPSAEFKRKVLYARELVRDAHYRPFDMVRKAVASGDAEPSFVSTLIENAEKEGRLDEVENDIRYAAGALYAAGSDPTKTVLQTFFLAMVLHPAVYKKAQEELDRVVGNTRLPTLEDRPNLPYIDCVIKETYRAMTRNVEQYSDAEAFRPERFLSPEIEDPRNIVFGYGPRLCPGRLFADTTLFLAIASVAATLNIEKARHRRAASSPRKLRSYLRLSAYDCAITPRSSAAMNLVADALVSVTE